MNVWCDLRYRPGFDGPWARFAAVLAVFLTLTVASPAVAQQARWPGWRGDGNGVSHETDLPVEWSEADGGYKKQRPDQRGYGAYRV